MDTPFDKNYPIGGYTNKSKTDYDLAYLQQVFSGMKLFLLIFTAFTIVQAIYLLFFADPTMFHYPTAFICIFLNIIAVVSTSVLVLVNEFSPNLFKTSKKLFRAGMHFYAFTIFFIILGQTHIAGSSNSPLPMAIPIVAFLFSWLIGTIESWFYFLLGTFGLIALFVVEKAGLLPYFPLYNGGDIPVHVFLDTRYLVIKIVIYCVVSVTVLHLLHRFRKDLQQRNLELAELSEKLEVLATTDSLTGLMNRRTMLAHLKREADRSSRLNRRMVVAMADLDNFKSINDTYGHAVGDLVLQEFSSTINETLRPYDLLSRFGGEEFLFAITNIDKENGIRLVERAREAVEKNEICVESGSGLKVTASFGYTFFDPDNPLPVDQLIHTADEALYVSKNEGKNRVTLM